MCVLAVSLAAAAPVRGQELTVGEIAITTEGIFTEAEVAASSGAVRVLREAMNAVHVDTRHYVIRKELLFATGERFDPALLAETERNLRDLGYLNNIRIAPVDTTADRRVNIRVTTREAWTLRSSFAYSRASDGDQRWNVQLSDGNFLGHGVTVGAGLGADENASFWNLWYRQRRLFGAGFWLGLDYSQRGDGHVRQVIFNRPFYALDDPWSSELRAWHREYDRRFFLSNAGPAGLDPSRTASLHANLPYREKGLEVRFALRTSARGEGRVWRVGGGVDVADRVWRGTLAAVELDDGRIADLRYLAAGDTPFNRDTGLEVRPFLWLRSEGRTWARARFVLQFGPIEDIPLDWKLDLRTGPSGGAVGSTAGYGDARWHSQASLRRWFPAGAGHLLLHGRARGDLGSRRVRNYRYEMLAGWVGSTGAEDHPWTTRIFAEYGQGRNLLGSEALLLGLDRGLRTLDFDGMAGDHLVRWNLEQGRVLAGEPLGLVRFGLAAFYAGGRAWWADELGGADAVRHEAGLGIRFGPTRSANARTARIDLAWDLGGAGGPVLTAITRGTF